MQRPIIATPLNDIKFEFSSCKSQSFLEIQTRRRFSAMHATNKAMTGSFGPLQAECSGVQRRKYKRYTKRTYIGLLAYVIQDSPNKMLTFKQIMRKVDVFVSGDRKGLENNIRVCLSSNKCFVKVPVDPEYPNANRNFWKVDESCITPKMLRRHFSDMADMFPGLVPKWPKEPEMTLRNIKVDTSADCTDRGNKCPVRFSSPFSIESLLKKDNSERRRPTVKGIAQSPGGTRQKPDALTPGTNVSVLGLDRCYGTTGELKVPHKQHHNFTNQLIYSSPEELRGQWNPAKRMHEPTHHHARGLLNTNQIYDQSVLAQFSHSHLYTSVYDLRYLAW